MLNLIVRRIALIRLLRATVRFNSIRSGETYYDVLKVREDCSNREIRNAFVQLSKKFHPDVKGAVTDPQQTAKFVRISEAYQTLSKPKSRFAYDRHLGDAGFRLSTHQTNTGNAMQNAGIHRPWEVKPNYDSEPKPYYGVKGIEKITNWKVAAVLSGICIFGAMLGFMSVKNSFTFSQQKLDAQSVEAGNYHATIRANAEKYGNDEQLRRMLHRMMKEEK